MSSGRISWGIIGCGGIASRFAEALPHSDSGVLAAVGSRDASKAIAFGAKFGLSPAQCHGSYEALLADSRVQAVYIATPHPGHLALCLAAAAAGKHILCEKPLTLSEGDAMVAAAAAREAGVLLMEAFMYRCAPQTLKIVELVRSGVIGPVRMIQAAFSFRSGFNPNSRLFNAELGGGGILDVGCYPVSFARLIAGAASSMPFADPVRVSGVGRVHPVTGVDVQASAVLQFANGIDAQVSCGIEVSQDNSARIYGELGWIHVPWPWIPAREGGVTEIHLHRAGAPSETIQVRTDAWLYALETDAAARAIHAGQLEAPEMSVGDTLGNLRVLDVWRRDVRAVLPSDLPEGRPLTARGTKLQSPAKPRIPRATLQGRPVSRLVLGVDNQRNVPHAFVMFDSFFELGGNAFDTAHIYADGAQERLLGQWMRTRGVRDEVFVLSKGGHTPWCNPVSIEHQLRVSLDRMQIACSDLHILHRDNTALPVDELMDVLHAQVVAGRTRAYGASNWSLERVLAANAYAARKGYQPLLAVSNQFSLARMVDAIWGGCLSAREPAFEKFFRETGTALFAWSSQARGFFTDRAAPDRLEDPELVRCWYAADNWARRDRVVAFAKERGVSPIQVALAWVLHQEFPVFALIGPRTVTELHSSLPALDIHLTPEEVRALGA